LLSPLNHGFSIAPPAIFCYLLKEYSAEVQTVFSGIGLDISGSHLLAIVASLLVAVGIAYWTYRRTNPPLPRGLKILLFALRAMAIGLLAFVLLEPILSLVWRRMEEPVVALLVDTSVSMSISEGPRSRLAQAQGFLGSSALEEISSQNRLQTYCFAEDLTSWGEDSLRAEGLATDMARALEGVKAELSEENLSAVVILTDGANNLGRNPAHLAGLFGLPIYPVGVGSADPRRDISLKEVQVNEVVYVDSRVPVEVTIQSQGLEGVTVPLVLSDGRESLDSKQVTLGGEGREQKVQLEFIPREVGIKRLGLSIPLQDGELAAENNQRDLSVKVLQSKIRVLLVWGSPSWDFAFLRRSLERDPNVQLTPLAMKKGTGYFLSAFPQSESQLLKHDVVILGDLSVERLGALQQEWLYRFVAEGGRGMLLLGGPGFRFGPGSPLLDLLPWNITAGRVKVVEDRFSAQLTPAGRVHPVMALTEDVLDVEDIWQDLPPFLGLNQFGPIKPGAAVLAVHSLLQAEDRRVPIVAVQPVGMGKVIMVAAYPLWRWDFMLQGLGKNGRVYDRFWSNIIRWLTTREEGQLVRVVPESNVFRSGQGIAFRARLFDESYRPMDRAQVKVTVTKKGTPGQVEAQGDLFESGRRDGRYQGELGVLSPGEYVYRAEVLLGGQQVGEAEGEFLVEEYSLEFDRVELNEPLLRAMAEVSGGSYFTLDDVQELPDRLRFESRQASHKREIELWNHPGMLVVLVLILAAEWTIRKRNRLM
jgi:hypothetical protein